MGDRLSFGVLVALSRMLSALRLPARVLAFSDLNAAADLLAGFANDLIINEEV